MRRRAEILSWLGTRIGKPPGFERLVRWIVPPEKCVGFPEVCLVRDGCLFVTRLSLPPGWHIAFFGSYESQVRDVMRTVLPSGGVAIDAGANAGWHTLLMARLVGPQGRVVAIEANPSVRDHLVRNVELNRLSQVEIIPCAIAESERTLDFFAPASDHPDSAGGHVVSEAAAAAGSIRINARRIDAIVSDLGVDRVDLIKVDVEGFEWPALQGGENTVARFRPYVLFEFDAAQAVRGNGGPAQFLAFFRRYDYRLFFIGRTWAEIADSSPWPSSANVLAAPLGAPPGA